MIFNTPGKITDRIWLVGRKESCAYVVGGGNEYVLLGGAMAYVAPDVIDQLEAFGIDEKKIRRIVVLHSHFDHCGMVPVLKRRWPWATVTASLRGRELLQNPKVIENIVKLNRAMLKLNGLNEGAHGIDLKFTGIAIEAVVVDGDVLECNDLSLEILEVPGHSSCSIAVYIPQEKALFASDAAGIPFGDKIFTAANSNFDLYQQSLKKMAAKEIDLYLAEHYGALSGTPGQQFLDRSIEAAAETRQTIEAIFAQSGDVTKATQDITDRIMADAPEGFLSREVVAIVAGQMVKFIAKAKTTC